MSCLMTKPTKWLCAQRRLRSAWASAQSDQSSLCTQWVAKDPSFLHADSKDSDQTGRMPRLIWVFAGRTCHFVGFVMRRLNYKEADKDYKNVLWAWEIEKSVWGSLFGIRRLCQVMPNSDPEGQIFLSAPMTYDRFFFLHTVDLQCLTLM